MPIEFMNALVDKCFMLLDYDTSCITLTAMIRENRQLVADEPVEFTLRNNWLKFETAGKLPIVLEEFM